MIYFVCIFFGLVPSAIWLSFYLRKDAHPESKRMILKIFFYGMLIALTAAAIEIIIEKSLNFANKGGFISPLAFSVLYYFIGVAFVEEFLKYFVVKKKVLSNSAFDEPTDAMIYMIVAALGFAALENILVLFPGLKTFTFLETTTISSLRFIGATFLHALCSGTVGFFLALSILKPRKRLLLISSGLAIATILHGLYNFSIMEIDKNFYFIFVPIVILSALAFFVSFGFRKLKKIKSVCQINE
jgi:RsiW-degrading membrane proteinase PrsW (M82 family)